MGLYSYLFGPGKIRQALQQGAVIIDVRTVGEFDLGRVPGSVNIPVDRLSVNIERIRQMNKPVVVCGASGIRSSIACSALKAAGIKNVFNGGNWESVARKLKSL